MIVDDRVYVCVELSGSPPTPASFAHAGEGHGGDDGGEDGGGGHGRDDDGVIAAIQHTSVYG